MYARVHKDRRGYSSGIYNDVNLKYQLIDANYAPKLPKNAGACTPKIDYYTSIASTKKKKTATNMKPSHTSRRRCIFSSIVLVNLLAA